MSCLDYTFFNTYPPEASLLSHRLFEEHVPTLPPIKDVLSYIFNTHYAASYSQTKLAAVPQFIANSLDHHQGQWDNLVGGERNAKVFQPLLLINQAHQVVPH